MTTPQHIALAFVVSRCRACSLDLFACFARVLHGEPSRSCAPSSSRRSPGTAALGSLALARAHSLSLARARHRTTPCLYLAAPNSYSDAVGMDACTLKRNHCDNEHDDDITTRGYVNKPQSGCTAQRVGSPSWGQRHRRPQPPGTDTPSPRGGRPGGLFTALFVLTSAFLTSTLF